MAAHAEYGKHQVDYSKGKVDAHCGPVFSDDSRFCENFIPGAGIYGQCKKVRGNIDPTMWCKEFERSLRGTIKGAVHERSGREL